ncbi:transglycosylase domain-containing protein [Chryseobacterium indoltheticum]|uniref:Membrane carboxypeptidase/penicillin-binding protein n=1 Tax=Chryseobacterium indoltheticum TaxID=254 RepID=A0A381FF87_9FLAO|nr:transglycosylase domain-containing protein [Chryseobacterium indoltheticum]AZA60540.1 hypothetical protein EG340_05595 [Chryseobacterium indoltheticum]SUX45201.1 Membrane carboxypeptidase/penicillin-binding protein [Chryseobacterium indoltheticum]
MITFDYQHFIMKILKRILLLLFLILIVFLLYIEIGGTYILNNDAKRTITFNIRSSRKLPKNITSFYNTIYKNSLSKNSWDFFLTTSSQKDCPCYQMTHRIMPQLNIKNTSALDYILVTRYIEHNFSQNDCLNYNLKSFNFLENRKGIETVSKSLFNKPIENLHLIEVAEIFSIYEHPLKYNQNRNPENSKKRIEQFYQLYLENLEK